MPAVRGLSAALNSAGRYAYKAPELAVDYMVVGAGVVGLAIAQRLATKFPERSTYVVERHSAVGQEVSSRNSEVIHGGLYYPSDSLKTKMCVRGRELLYTRCQTHSVPYRKLGKLVVGHSSQRTYLENMHAHCQSLRMPRSSSQESAAPTKLLSGAEAREMEPELADEIDCALWSPETGIVDSHALMEGLEREVAESEGGAVVLSTRVVRVDPAEDEEGWVVQTVTNGSEEPDAMLARTLISSSGLSGQLILNSLLARANRPLIPMYYAKGTYLSYKGPGAKKVTHLIYPVPELGDKKHGHAGLGMHSTLDLAGNVRFGPDVEWISPPSAAETEDFSTDENDVDFWARHLVADDSRLTSMHEAITNYLPGVIREGLNPDYCGVRPKLVGPAAGFQDFVVRVDWSGGAEGRGGQMVSMMGIESPGLTSSLALAEMVVEDTLVS